MSCFQTLYYILETGAEPPKPTPAPSQVPSFISLDSLVVPSMVLGDEPYGKDEALEQNFSPSDTVEPTAPN
ncbi:MAG: hypothetical protein HC796_06405 [Synechococcaceae cyanobacterium RL_1_2]|nr:hypothetical protein [Synechococcaceae cyanobacterium RL_1_2]